MQNLLPDNDYAYIPIHSVSIAVRLMLFAVHCLMSGLNPLCLH